jgi:predicted transcriptional regulator
LALPSGRLDLLLVSLNELFLVELKAERFKQEFVDQLVGYRDDLIQLQNSNSLVLGNISAVLLVTEFYPDDEQTCKDRGIRLISYDPEEVLKTFYEQMAGVSGFLTVRPIDLGVWHISVINRVLYALPDSSTIDELSQVVGIATNTTRNHLRFGEQLGLVRRYEHRYFLTDLGTAYIEARDQALSLYQLSDGQIELLRRHIVRDPFSSDIVFGIYGLVESVFTLARNSYPVTMKSLMYFYRDLVGKKSDWATARSAFLGANAFSNFAVELGLIARVGDNLMLTPAGFRFILMLQLHKGIRIIDSLGEGRL